MTQEIKKLLEDFFEDQFFLNQSRYEEGETSYVVIGLLVEKYIGNVVYGHNCNFETVQEELEKFHIFCREEETGDLYKVSLWETYGECGSGWTTATYGNYTITKVEHIEPFTHRPIDSDIRFKIGYASDRAYQSEDVGNGVFFCSEDGGDPYYPSGGVNVNMELFKPLARAMEKRPVYVFYGGSGLGKSTLAGKTGCSVFETDAVDILPDEITADIVVVGNRSGFSLEDVVGRIPEDARVIKVNFC